MRRFVYGKLVRNKILDDMIRHGEKPQYRVLDDKDYLIELQKKILEEAAEINFDDREKVLSELADLQEVVDCMLEAINITTAELVKAKEKKNTRVGSFDKRIYIDDVSIPDENPWINYLEKNSDRYPEIK